MTPTNEALFKVLLVSTSYPATLDDWRGLFIRHLCDALARRSDLQVNFWGPPGYLSPNVNYFANDSEAKFLTELMQAGGIAHLLRNGGVDAVSAPLRLLSGLRKAYRRANSADLYHVNWLQNSLPIPNNKVPLLVSALGSDMQLLAMPLTKPLLRRVFGQRKTIICPNADWMLEPLSLAFGDVAQIRVVPFGIDPSWFSVARQLSELPRWLVVSRLTRAKIGPLFEWCEPLFNGQGRELHLFGPMQEAIEIPEWVHYHGPASPDVLCKQWFPYVHGLITLSRHAEGRPQVMLEAMAAQLPIVASSLSAHDGIVFHRETGWTCENSRDVAEGILNFENTEENFRAGLAARDWVTEEIGTWDDCAGRYVHLYGELMR